LSRLAQRRIAHLADVTIEIRHGCGRERSAINVLPVTDVQDGHRMLLVVDFIDDAVNGIASSADAFAAS
jgi:hypothetical protein